MRSTRELFEIPEVLVPYTEFDATDLGLQLHNLVVANTEILVVRGISGVVARYSNISTAVEKVRKGQSEQAQLGHFAIVNATGDVSGSASIYPGLQLKKQHVPLPPAITPSFLVDLYPKAGTNIHAWTAEHDTDLLADAYKDLVLRTTGWWRSPIAPKIWTIEPTRSPESIHEAIQVGGLEKVATRRFDDGDSRRHIPPRSTLYSRLYSEWATAHGKQKEVRTGATSFWTGFDEEANRRGPKK